MGYYYNLGMFFEDVVDEFSDNLAIKCQDKVYTYTLLNQKANIFANFLVQQKIEMGDVIAIANTKEFESFALMIACLKIGAAYVNLDIDSPVKRVEKVIRQCSPKIIFFDRFDGYIDKKEMIRVCNDLKIKCYSLCALLSEDSDHLDTFDSDIVKKVDGNAIAYIMFTSGSTGIPKGVAITHQNVIHFINWSLSFYHIDHNDIFANLSPFYFDNSVFDFYSALFSGASLVAVKKEILIDPVRLIKYIDQSQCTIWFSVPSLLIYLMTMKALNLNVFKSVRVIAFGGEGYPKSELVKIYKLFKDRAMFVNVYGPTECTCICSAYILKKNDFDDLNGLPTLGKINQNFSYLILDDNGHECSEGELCLMGPNVGAGYYKNKKKSGQFFVEYDQGRSYMKKMYKTGDIVKEVEGLLYFVGRKDNQIKHMGHRIELEEIEVALNAIDGVDQAAVIYKRVNTSFGKIIAFIGSKDGAEQKYVAGKLKRELPDYMLPNRINILESLPKNSNGKVNKKHLATL